MRLGIELARSVWTPALAESLASMLARVNLAYLTALDGLPCCPKCAGIRRQENSMIRDAAQLMRAGCGNSLSLAAWQLAEAWKDGDAGARLEVLPGSVPTAGAGGIHKKCPSGQVWTVFESPPGSGQMHGECRTLDIKAALGGAKPQGSPPQAPCPPGQIRKTFESPPGSGNMITQCQPGSLTDNVSEKKKMSMIPTDPITVFRYLVHKRGNVIDIAKHYAETMGGCACG